MDEEGYALNTDYQFNLMVALDENYTLIGLKRLPRAKQKNRTAASQCAADYADRVPDIAQWLETRAARAGSIGGRTGRTKSRARKGAETDEAFLLYNK